MIDLINSLGKRVVGVVSGFDRIVFRGTIQPLMFPEGTMGFFSRRRILFRDARDWVLEQTQRLVSAVDDWSRSEGAGPIAHLMSSRMRKEELARTRQAERGIETGLIGVWSVLESGKSIRLVPGAGRPRLRAHETRCKHLYTYLEHPEYGFMSLRIQTWFPYQIQIALNGREWLCRQLAAAGVGFKRSGNKILALDDFAVAQQFLQAQIETNWLSVLDGFVPIAFPTWRETLGEGLSYRWSLWQSELATDILLRSAEECARIIDPMVHHAFVGGHPDRLLRYFGRDCRRDGRPRRNRSDTLSSGVLTMEEGCRVRHWHGANSVKLYNEHNVIRVETTINDPSAFRVQRRKQGAPASEPKQRLPLRKGIADTALRARVSQEINDRFAQHLATTQSPTPFGDELRAVVQPCQHGKRRTRALDPIGKDLELLRCIGDPRFAVAGLSNRDLRLALAADPRLLGKTDRQRSRWVTRALRLLRDHGLLRKQAGARRYHLTLRGRALAIGTQAFLAASLQTLTRAAA